MKVLILLTALLSSSLVSADSVNVKVRGFKGELKITEPDFKVTSIVLLSTNQFCNFWGTTCAGGPNESVEAAVKYKVDSRTNLITFSTEGLKNKTSKLSNRFSSCRLNLKIAGTYPNGKKEYGTVGLIYENRKETCESESALAEIIAHELRAPVEVKLIPYNW